MNRSLRKIVQEVYDCLTSDEETNEMDDLLTVCQECKQHDKDKVLEYFVY